MEISKHHLLLRSVILKINLLVALEELPNIYQISSHAWSLPLVFSKNKKNKVTENGDAAQSVIFIIFFFRKR